MNSYRIILFILAAFFSIKVQSQNVFDPMDPTVRYSAAATYGSAQRPDTARPGLQKWVSVPTNGVSTGYDGWDATSFKAYYIKFTTRGVAFRLKFPASYLNPDSAQKKYPLMLFFHGAGSAGCETNGGIYNNEAQLSSGGKLFKGRVDNKSYDGFLLYPQMVQYNGTCAGDWGTNINTYYSSIVAILDSLVKYARLDNDRVMVNGLSAGGNATWKMAEFYPQRVSYIAPSSAAGLKLNYGNFIHVPVWLATGGLDFSPSPSQARYTVNAINTLGGYIKYTLYPDLGHAVWSRHWMEPGYVDWMNQAHKANPLVFFQMDAFCPDSPVNAKLGITQGFYAYEWQKDGITVASQSNGVITLNNTSVVSAFTGNNITVKQYGTYRVRFQRTATSGWSVWSPLPVVIGIKGPTYTAPIEVDGNYSRVVPSLDGRTTVPLRMKTGYARYEWYKVPSTTVVSTKETYVVGPGDYKGLYFEKYNCSSIFSPVFRVVNANGSPKPDAASSLQAAVISPFSVRLQWTDNPSPAYNETGYEIYRSIQPDGPYQFISVTATDQNSFVDTGLAQKTIYYYVVRAVNETGASPASNQAMVRTNFDVIPPSAPAYLLHRGATSSSVSLKWEASTDNSMVKRYDIYVNGEKLYSTPNTFFTVYNLDAEKAYTFSIKAVDDSGNESPFSNQLAAFTHQQGIKYRHYTGTWTYLPDFNQLTPVKSGVTDSIRANSSVRIQSDNYGFLFEGYLYIPETGTYTLEINSDEGSKFFLDAPYSYSGTALINNDSLHFSRGKLSKPILLKKGYHPFSVPYFEATGVESLFIYWSNTNGLKRERIPKGFYTPIQYSLPASPADPSDMTATALNSKTIRLQWKDNSNNESGFEIQRALSSAGPFAPVATIGKDQQMYDDSTLQGSTLYYYRIRSVGLTGESAYINSSATTPAELILPVPATPSQLDSKYYGGSALSLSWNDNSINESGFEIWRSASMGSGYNLIASVTANTNAYIDKTINPDITYYYYVVAINDKGSSDPSNVLRVMVGNTAPVFGTLNDVFIKTGSNVSVPFSVTDNPGDEITVQFIKQPAFVKLIKDPDAGSYSLGLSPTIDNIGNNEVILEALDQLGHSTIRKILVSVADVNTTSVYINFGNAQDLAAKPWNNWPGVKAANSKLTGLTDETGSATGISIEMIDAWASINDLGFKTGRNAGVFPDTVLESGLMDAGPEKRILISGLNLSKKYNLVVMASRNEGLSVPIRISAAGQTDSINARYNSRETGNLNEMVPDAGGNILLTMKELVDTTNLYLNGLVIEEYTPSSRIQSPLNLFVEQTNTTSTVSLTWSDRTANENASGGYQVQRATDSLFTTNLYSKTINGNMHTYKLGGLSANTRYWFRVRSRVGTVYSDFSNKVSFQTPAQLIDINFNYTVANPPSSWNSLMVDPVSPISFNLKTTSKGETSIRLSIEKPFNGEFIAGMNTGVNNGVVPDNVLRSNYWIDKTQITTIRISGLNIKRRYSFGFIGSSSPVGWFKANYTMTYTINGQTVYLNSWQNTTRIVYINNIEPDDNGEVLIQFSTTAEAAYGFTAGMIIFDFPELPGSASDFAPNQAAPGKEAVEMAAVEAEKELKVYPNPFTDQFIIELYNEKASDKFSISIHDPAGRLIDNRHYYDLPAGNNRLVVPNPGRSAGNGMYILTIRRNGIVYETRKLIKRIAR